MRFAGDAALVDIEGTLGSIAFVHEVLFPYAAQRLDAFVAARADEPPVRAALDAAAREAGVAANDRAAILAAFHRWSAADVKIAPLKELQGLIWRDGFESGALRAHLYPDAVAALRRFHAAGIRTYVYSSGSVAAQHLVFAYSIAGDLRPLLHGYFDLTTGPKRDPASYQNIAAAVALAPARIVFFSDNADELDAAQAAALQTFQLARPSDAVTPSGKHTSADTFDGIHITNES